MVLEGYSLYMTLMIPIDQGNDVRILAISTSNFANTRYEIDNGQILSSLISFLL